MPNKQGMFLDPCRDEKSFLTASVTAVLNTYSLKPSIYFISSNSLRQTNPPHLQYLMVEQLWNTLLNLD